MKRKLLLFLLLPGALIAVGTILLVGRGLTDHKGHADLAVVFGNTVHPDGTPSRRLQGRLDKAVDLYREGFFPRILVSGATGKEGVPEGSAMKAYLVEAGVPASAILVDNAGVDTRASARNAAAILRAEGGKSAFVITQFFHVPRAELALHQAGIPSVFRAHAAYFEPRDLYATARELPAFLKYLCVPATPP